VNSPGAAKGLVIVSERNSAALSELTRAAGELLKAGRAFVADVRSPDTYRAVIAAHEEVLTAEAAYFMAAGEVRLTSQPWRNRKTFKPPLVMRYRPSIPGTEEFTVQYAAQKNLAAFNDFWTRDRAALRRYLTRLRKKHFVKRSPCSLSFPSKSSPVVLPMTRPSPRSPDAT
jgi:hypothetical protein